MKKNCLAVILAAVMMVTACGGGNGQGTNGDTEQREEKETFRVAFISDQELDASEWLINLVEGVKKYEVDGSKGG